MAAWTPAKTERDIKRAIMDGLRASAESVKARALGNLARVLKSRTGKLASSIYSRARQTRYGGYLEVGAKAKYARFWEYGFMRGGGAVRGKKRGTKVGRKRVHTKRTEAQRTALTAAGAKSYQRPFLKPTAEQSYADVRNRIAVEVDRAMQTQFGSVTIDLKIM